MQQRWTQFGGVVLVLLLSLAVMPATAQTDQWFAEYFNNINLQGSPDVTRFEATPSDNWGLGSPSPVIDPNTWSARWTRTTFLDGGRYRFQVRPDDAVRVYFDGNLIINEWHGYRFETYQADVDVTTGTHTIVVEYYDATAEAFLNYGLSRVDTLTPIFPNQTQAVITTDFLNLRDQPNETAVVLGLLRRGQQYPVLDRSGNWLQINAGSAVGWVDTQFVDIVNVDTPPTAPIQPTVTVTTGLLNVRNAPDPIAGDVIAQIQRGDTYPAIRQSATNNWIQIRLDGRTGWVNNNFVQLNNLDLLPETAVDVRATVTAGRLNVRRQPTTNADVLLKINRGETYPVLGRNDTGSWVQMNVNGTIGWVNTAFVALSRDVPLPVTVGVAPDLPVDDEIVVTATPYPVNIRTGPGTQFDDIGNLPNGDQAVVIGRNASGTWWQINYNGIVGWVTAQYTRLELGVDPGVIPITS